MARAQKEPTGQVNKWEKELAEMATVAAEQEASAATGQFFGLKGGRLTFNDAPLPNNEMAVVVLDGILENVYYEGKYDPESLQSPTCFAFGRDEREMRPHDKVVSAQNPQCMNCPLNQFGSADVGKGKACRNTRRLAMIAAGTIQNGRFTPFEDLDHFKTAAIAYMKLPVTSVKGYATFVKQLAGTLKRPPFAVFTKVKVVPDDKSQFKVTFEALATAPTELLNVLKKRHEEAKEAIDFPYIPAEEVEKPAKGAKKPANKRKY
jgi:hypothetical protein